MANKASHIAWHGPSWRLRVEELSLPDGSMLERGFIEHPGAVVLVPLRLSAAGEPEVLVLRQYRAAINDTILELPAGTRGWDEEWLACAQRELQEETGYRAEHFTSLGEVWPAPGLSNELMALYLATELSPAPLAADIDEIIEVQAMPLAQLVAMAYDGVMRDAKSIVAILKTAAYLGKPNWDAW